MLKHLSLKRVTKRTSKGSDLDHVSRVAKASGLISRSIHHKFGNNEVLTDVSFEVKPGEVLCLLGPSGSGKSTCLRVISGVERLQEGEVSVDGNIVASSEHHIPPEKRGVGLMFQDYALFPHLTVSQNVAYGIKKFSSLERNKRVERLLNLANINTLSDCYPHTLSGGEQQRVALLRALAPEPTVMLLDEPFSSLDFRLRSRMREDTIKILRHHKVAIVLVTHDAEEAMFIGDRIVLMDRGKIIQTGTPENLYYSPNSEFTASFFGDVNIIREKCKNGVISTFLGDFNAKFPNGHKVSLIFRPEDIKISIPNTTDFPSFSTVTEVRSMGRKSLLKLTHEGIKEPILAIVEELKNIKPGSKVLIQLDPSRAFVFPAK